MKTSLLLSIAALLAVTVNAIPRDLEMTKDLELQDDFEVENALEVPDLVTELELNQELELAEDLECAEEEAEGEDLDAFGRRRRRCLRGCYKRFRRCRNSIYIVSLT